MRLFCWDQSIYGLFRDFMLAESISWEFEPSAIQLSVN